jgi:ATP-dependent Zn protease
LEHGVEPDLRLSRQMVSIGAGIVRSAGSGDISMDKWVEFAVAWLPFLLLIGFWFWFSRRNGMQARGSSGVTMIELYEQQVAETRRMNGFLERIAISMEKHEASRGS